MKTNAPLLRNLLSAALGLAALFALAGCASPDTLKTTRSKKVIHEQPIVGSDREVSK